MEGKKYLDYDGLEKYHSQIKQYINDNLINKYSVFEIELKNNALVFSRTDHYRPNQNVQTTADGVMIISQF